MTNKAFKSSGTFRVSAIPGEHLDEIRAARIDVSGHPVEHLTAGGGEPLRCCLRDARDGEELILFGYQPALPASPYTERGAVYAHARRCAGPPDDGYPAAWRGRAQVLRAYDRRGWIADAVIHDGADPETVIDKLFADPAVTVLHSRNPAHGCYMFAVHHTAGS